MSQKQTSRSGNSTPTERPTTSPDLSADSTSHLHSRRLPFPDLSLRELQRSSAGLNQAARRHYLLVAMGAAS